MKKSIRILLPILLAIVIVACLIWYLFVYDREFTRDMLLGFARFSENQGNHAVATWFYNRAYDQAGDNEAVAIELAEQYKRSGNYTKAEYTLSNAIADGGGVDVYVALCKTYVEQDKLLDAVNMLNSITNEQIKAELDAMRPAAPTALPDPGFYSQYISVSIETDGGTLYVTTDGQYPSTKNDPYTKPITLGDGENTLYALTVAENGLVSPLSIFGYTVGGVIEEMKFADAAVEAEVRKLLNVADDKLLYTNELWTISSFTIPEGATSYADLEHMPFLKTLTIGKGVSAEVHHISALANLEELVISDTAVTQEDLSAIASLPLLEKLTLQNCSLSSIRVLETATGITNLDLSNNTIRSIDALASMKSLQEVYLQHNAIASLAPLSGISTLTKLDVSYNALTSLAPLSGITTLNWLDASNNSITDLGNIGDMSALTYLSVGSNKLKDVTDIAACKVLTDLNISSNALTDISALSALTNMMYFDFSYNEVTTLPTFPKDCALVTIDGSHNKLGSLDSLSGLESLNNVHMDYNEGISSVKALASCPVLIEVNVYATKVTDVTDLTNQSIIVNYNPVQ